MKNLIVVIICFLVSTSVFSADYYRVGDTLFVWAKSGLNVRTEPSTKASIIEKIPFGEQITITEWCDKAFYIKAVDVIENPYNENEVIGPLIFKGQWVKITTFSGKTGFVINQYILHLEPLDKTNSSRGIINFSVLKTDTIRNNDSYLDTQGIYARTETQYENEITVTTSSGESWGSVNVEIPHLSMTEALVLISSSWIDLNEFKVVRNWEESVILEDEDGLCTIIINRRDDIDGVMISLDCSC